MKIVNAHKGVTVFRTTVTGKEAHSSQPHRAASAIEAAARLIGFLADLAEEKRAQAPADSRFEPPFTSFNVGTIQGGTAQNIVPRHCTFTWEYRELPGDDGAAILERFTPLRRGPSASRPQGERARGGHRDGLSGGRTGAQSRAGLRGRGPGPRPDRRQHHSRGLLRRRRPGCFSRPVSRR